MIFSQKLQTYNIYLVCNLVDFNFYSIKHGFGLAFYINACIPLFTP